MSRLSDSTWQINALILFIHKNSSSQNRWSRKPFQLPYVYLKGIILCSTLNGLPKAQNQVLLMVINYLIGWNQEEIYNWNVSL